MGIRVLLVGVFLTAAACGGSGAGAAPTSTGAPDRPTTTVTGADGVSFGEFDTPDGVRNYRLLVPQGTEGPVPLVLDFHGAGSDVAEQERLSGFAALGAEAGFIVVQPQARGIPPLWRIEPAGDGAPSPDVAFVEALVAELSGRYPIDPDRVYAAGMSNGGGLAHRLACESDLIAAAAGVAGAYAGWSRCEPDRPVPFLAVHGTEDLIVPFDGGGIVFPALDDFAAAWAERNDCTGSDTTEPAPEVTRTAWSGCGGGADVVLFAVSGAGHGWPGTADPDGAERTSGALDATGVIWDFFAAHPRR